MLKIVILNGNAFRNLFQNLFITLSSVNFICSQNSLKIEQANVTNEILHKVTFNIENLIYDYQATDDFILGVNINDLIRSMKIVSKRDTIILEMLAPTSKLKITAVSNTGITNETFLTPKNVNFDIYDLPSISPKCEVLTILTIEFSKQLVSLLAVKPLECFLEVYDHGIILKTNDTLQKTITFGECSGSSLVYRMDLTMLKGLSKTPNIGFSRSIIKLYKLDGCICFKIPFILGDYAIYVRES
jgi:hypothetical protein